MASFVRVVVLIWADILAGYAMWVLQTYLTDVWKLSFTHAAAIINVWNGLASIVPIASAFFVDSFMGNYPMLLLSSIAYSLGLGFLAMSTPPVLPGTCKEYRPECIGHTQRALFYTALSLIVVGISGHLVSLLPFFTLQTESSKEDKNKGGKSSFQEAGAIVVVIVGLIGGIALPYIKPWSIRFGIPAICTLVATLLFVSGSCHYTKDKPEGSPLTTLLRVLVACASKISLPLPDDPKQLYEKDEPEDETKDKSIPKPLPYSHGLRCLDKAAIVLPNKDREEQEKDRWRLCSLTEVEEIKNGIRMVPMWLTFTVSGTVLSIGNTYFLEQAKHMNPRVGKLKVPLQVFKLLSDLFKSQFVRLYPCMANFIGSNKYAPPIGIAISMIFSVLCCITAAKVETQRIQVIRKFNLFNKPDETIPMTLFWLLPQFFLLSGLDAIFSSSIEAFFKNQAPLSTRKYLAYFSQGVLGLGHFGSVLSVSVVGKISGKGGHPNWFKYTLNRSRLDRFYWTLAAISAVNLVVFILVAFLYPYRESTSEDEEARKPGAPSAEPYEEDNAHCFCCG